MADFQMWSALQSAMQDDGARRRVDRATWRRVGSFARPHRRTIVAFLALATVSALLGVATPVLAGRAVDAIVEGRATSASSSASPPCWRSWPSSTPGVGLLERLESSRLGERLILDLRRRVFGHVQSMPIAFFTRTHTGRAGQPPQQRRHRRPAGVHVGAVRRGHQRHHARADARRDAPPVVADHACWPCCCCRCSCSRPGGSGHASGSWSGRRRAQRGDDVADDRALLGARAPRWSSCSDGRTTRRPSSARGPSGSARSACARRWRWRCSSGR